jgi:hypothetical protein
VEDHHRHRGLRLCGRCRVPGRVTGPAADLGQPPGQQYEAAQCRHEDDAERDPGQVVAVGRDVDESVGELNRSLVQGMLDGLGTARLAAALSPADGRCCVVVTAG